MRYLFVHQNFPGQFLHLVRHLVRQKRHEIVFVSQANDNVIPGVRRVLYALPRGAHPDTHPATQEFDLAMLRAEAVAGIARNLKSLGFVPDIIIGHQGWGEMLDLHDVFPDVPVLGYLEFYYHTTRFDVNFDPEFPMDEAMFPRVRAKNTINHLALHSGAHGLTPTLFQKSTYPDWAHGNITVLPEGVNLDICAPDPSARKTDFVLGDVLVRPNEKLVTYVARDLEPYRGFHVFMRALPYLLHEREDVRVVVVGGDGVSYGARLAQGSWREAMLNELSGRLDLGRVHFTGKLPYERYAGLLKRSDAHVYLTYPFVASWSLREAMATGCAIVASDTAPVQEFVQHGRTGLLTPFHDPKALAENLLDVLEDGALSRRLSRGARREAENTLAMGDYIAAFEGLIETLTGSRGTTPARARAKPARKVAAKATSRRP